MATVKKTPKRKTRKTGRKASDPFEIVASERGGQVRVQITMDSAECGTLIKALGRKRVMASLCEAATKSGLDKAMPGSWYCTICHGSGIRHQHTAKNWFNAFIESFGYCGPSFAMHGGKCKRPFVNHN